MSEESQKVVMIQDVSRETSLIEIRLALERLPLKRGDEITFLGILHQVNNPMGYKMKVDIAHPKVLEEEISRKTDEYRRVYNMEIVKSWKAKQIEVKVKVLSGTSPNTVALRAVKGLGATWVILDKQMKKDKKYFMDGLTCKISRMKSDNTIEDLRGRVRNVTYDEMIPGTPDASPDRVIISPQMLQPAKEISNNWLLENVEGGEPSSKSDKDKSPMFGKTSSSETLMLTTTASSSSLANTEASSYSPTDAKTSPTSYYPDEDYTTNTEELSPVTVWECHARISPMKASDGDNVDSPFLDHADSKGLYQTKDEFQNSVCSCGNRRPNIVRVKEFTYAELLEATEGFSPKNFLSEGGFGSVFRGRLKNRMYVAVKQHKHASKQGEKEFKAEITALSKARHENLVMLLGFCSEGTNRLLVYEYVCNGSLDQFLSKHSRRSFSWQKRIKIATGAARGLKYLHEISIIHRDMRPSNILVTHDHESMLGDFGLARTHEGDSDRSSETRVVGTLGYLAPEYAESGKVSAKTDVYAFGVVLLQLITGYTTNDKKLNGRSLVGWARPLLKEKNYPCLVDERIADSYDVHHLYWIVRIAEKCLSKEPQKRLTMNSVVKVLDFLANGDPSSTIREFSPAHSDTISVAESHGSNEDTTTAEQDSQFSSRTSVDTRSQLSGKLSSPSTSSYDTSIKRPSMPATSKQAVAQTAARKEKSRRGRLMKVKSALLYNEMVN